MLTQLLLVLVCVLLLIFITRPKVRHESYAGSHQRSTNLPKTSFKLLNDQHDEMLHAVDALYNICKNHWDTEDRLYKEGLEKMPPGHKATADLWAAHTAEHKSFLEKIEGLKPEIARHIKEYDIPQLHYGYDNSS